MRKLISLTMVLLMSFSVGFAEGGKRTAQVISGGTANHQHQWDAIDFDLDGKTLVITNHGRHRGQVEITEKYDLFVNGDKIKLNDEQQVLVKKFYDQSMQIVNIAKEMGLEGARIGAEGAKLGIKAIGGLIKMLLTDYDEEDLDYYLEAESEKIEERAELLEEQAEELEDLADELEYLAEEMIEEIPELEELDWY